MPRPFNSQETENETGSERQSKRVFPLVGLLVGFLVFVINANVESVSFYTIKMFVAKALGATATSLYAPIYGAVVIGVLAFHLLSGLVAGYAVGVWRQMR